jgi:hypothetical protein
MNQNAIFAPFLTMMLLTLVVWFYMYSKRIPMIPAQRGALHGQHRHSSLLALLHVRTGSVVHGLSRSLECVLAQVRLGCVQHSAIGVYFRYARAKNATVMPTDKHTVATRMTPAGARRPMCDPQ